MLTDKQRTYLKTERVELIQESAKLKEEAKQHPYEPNLALSPEERKKKYKESAEGQKELKDGQKRANDQDIRDKAIAALSDLALIAKYFPLKQNKQIFTDATIRALINNVLFPNEKDPKEKEGYIQDERTFRLGLLLAEYGIEAAYQCLDHKRARQLMGAKADAVFLWEKCERVKNAEINLHDSPQIIKTAKKNKG